MPIKVKASTEGRREDTRDHGLSRRSLKVRSKTSDEVREVEVTIEETKEEIKLTSSF